MAPPLVDRGLRRGLGRETELREPVLHVEVDPVARDNPVLDRRDVALAKAHTPARRGNVSPFGPVIEPVFVPTIYPSSIAVPPASCLYRSSHALSGNTALNSQK